MFAVSIFNLAAVVGRGAVCDNTLKDIADEEACLRRVNLIADRVGTADNVALRIKDLCIRIRLGVGSARSEGVVCGSHLER